MTNTISGLPTDRAGYLRIARTRALLLMQNLRSLQVEYQVARGQDAEDNLRHCLHHEDQYIIRIRTCLISAFLLSQNLNRMQRRLRRQLENRLMEPDMCHVT